MTRVDGDEPTVTVTATATGTGAGVGEEGEEERGAGCRVCGGAHEADGECFLC
jgi:hypothetical protein